MPTAIAKRSCYRAAEELIARAGNGPASAEDLVSKHIEECGKAGDMKGADYWREVFLYSRLLKQTDINIILLEDED